MSNIYTSKKIILVGYMGAGKSVISRKIALKTKINAIELDHYIEDFCKKSIVEIFKADGELAFRKVESQLFNTLINLNNDLIISTGGGTPCYFDNHKLLLLDNVISIYLKYQPKTLANRLIKNKMNRPLIKEIKDEELLEFISIHLFERNFYYSQAKYIIKCDEKSIDEIIDECLKLIL